MRYTTVIDISEIPEVYRCLNCRLLYIHMSLKCGYHDADRDLIRISVRNLAYRVGLTVSATRHALRILERSKLLTREGDSWRVCKWVEPAEIHRRPTKAQAKTAGDMDRMIREAEQSAADYRRRVGQVLRTMPLDELKGWLTELQDGVSRYHQRVQLSASKANVKWVSECLDYRIKNNMI